MDSSNEINQVVVDGQLTSVSLNDETGLYSQDGEPQNEQRKRSWRRGSSGASSKQKSAGESLEKDVESAIKTEADTVATKSAEEVIEIEESDNAKKGGGFSTALANFGASLLNVCTLGLFSSSVSPVSDQTVVTTEKIVQDLARSEQGLNTFAQDETIDSEHDTNQYMRDHALLSVNSSPSDEDSNSTGSIVSRLTKKKKTKTVVFYTIGIFLFLAMCGLFITGGIFLSKNGW
jgi:hypothetical protein